MFIVEIETELSVIINKQVVHVVQINNIKINIKTKQVELSNCYLNATTIPDLLIKPQQ